MQKISEGESIHFHSEPSFIPLPNHRKFLNTSYQLNEFYYSKYTNAELIGNYAVAISKNGEIIVDSAGLSSKDTLSKSNPRLLMKYHHLPIHQYDTVISLVDLYSNSENVNYYHWITDSLFKLECLTHLEERPHILINDNPTQFQLDSLNALGIERDRVIRWTHQRAIVKNLYVAGSRKTRIGNDFIVSPQAINWIKSKLIEKPSPLSFDRVYISRSDASLRQVLNEKELIPMLRSLDFEIITMSEFSFIEQVAIFQNAKVIVTPHGAGLSNIIFSKKTTVVELIGNNFSGDYDYSMFFLLAKAAGQRYFYLSCDLKFVSKNKKQHYNLQVDPQKLSRLLTNIIANED
jgi:hypothetical protein